MGQVLAQQLRCCLGLGSRVLHKKASIANIVQHKKPPLLAVAQPVVHQLGDVRLRVLPPGGLDPVGNLAEALLEPRCVAGVHPEHSRLRRLLVRTIGMLDGQLRLSSTLSAVDAGEAVPYSPHAPKTDERCPRVWRGASFLDISKYRPSLDKVFVEPKRDHNRWGW